MVKQPKYYFEAILGINAPWSIQDVNVDEKNKIIQVTLSHHTEKTRFSFFSKGNETESNKIVDTGLGKRWLHSSIGYYNCHIVSSAYDPNISSAGISRAALLQPNFLGDPNRNYTHQLRQEVALAYLRNLSPDAIANILRIDQAIVDDILSDIEKTPESYRLATCLPCESDPIWENMIYDKFHLKTQLFPLKLMLSKLKLSMIDPKVDVKLSDSVTELRKFFISHINALDSEVSQITALSMKKQSVEERRNVTTKLVLPALKNGIWLKLITGKIDLNSTNMPLNLFLVRLRHAFQNTEDNNIRVSALNSLREFFRKNVRSLKKELVLINQLMNAPEEAQYSLPDERSEIWKRILKDDTFIPSSHIAYKLLLSNLRSQILMNPDPVVELNAVRRVRDFIKHNQRFMQQELRMVLSNSR
ncbi:hypothetical protein [Cellvibrio sp. OA-2007]|uniref:hypothetical protein n=1 Tax=Cellvibrio sp. OA-2007 TaxID=529823 RepID=UPI000781123F|nr:hypothetical protein [Cellvibrio sp. OA-2007]